MHELHEKTIISAVFHTRNTILWKPISLNDPCLRRRNRTCFATRKHVWHNQNQTDTNVDLWAKPSRLVTQPSANTFQVYGLWCFYIIIRKAHTSRFDHTMPFWSYFYALQMRPAIWYAGVSANSYLNSMLPIPQELNIRLSVLYPGYTRPV